MSIKVKTTDGNCGVLVDENMTIYEAVDQKKRLLNILKKLKKKQQMDINLSNVNELDTAGLQILLLIKQTAAKAKQVTVSLTHSPATLDVIDRYNLAAYFGDPLIISSDDR